ncbi:hypothetical protein GJ744_004303 [Endocarpon pusillum]|uniref:Uncharacterized protein n=1 Tax=Endocarpon pusillum TaxID=364733 RepID=A0A8H7E1L3_9EURO|nr:hypothetical protein GJ744_004303 [Endocarpon pusillum]
MDREPDLPDPETIKSVPILQAERKSAEKKCRPPTLPFLNPAAPLFGVRNLRPPSAAPVKFKKLGATFPPDHQSGATIPDFSYTSRAGFTDAHVP